MPRKKTDDACKRLTATAYHEAGHVVARLLLRRPFRYVEIGMPTGELEGIVKGLPLPSSYHPHVETGGRMRTLVEKEIVILYAGPEAELHWRRPGAARLAKMPKLGLRLDDGKVVWVDAPFPDAMVGQLADSLNDDDHRMSLEEKGAYLKWLQVRARDLIREPEHWSMVETIAKALLKHTRLSYAEVRRVIREDNEARFGKWPKRRER